MSISRYTTRAEAAATGGQVSWVEAEDGKNWMAKIGLDVEPSSTARIISTEAFRDRFFPAELAAIVASTDAQIKVALLKLSTKGVPMIDLDNPEVISTMARLVTLGLVTADRSTAIRA